MPKPKSRTKAMESIWYTGKDRVTRELVQGDMSDKEWSDFKRKAAAGKPDVTVVKPAESSDLDDLQTIEASPSVEAAKPTEETKQEDKARVERSRKALAEAEAAKPSKFEGALETAKNLAEAVGGTVKDVVTLAPVRSTADKLIGGESPVPEELVTAAGKLPGVVAGQAGMNIGGAVRGVGEFLDMPNLAGKGAAMSRAGVEKMAEVMGPDPGVKVTMGAPEEISRTPDPEAVAQETQANIVPGQGISVSAKAGAKGGLPSLAPAIKQAGEDYRKAADEAAAVAVQELKNAELVSRQVSDAQQKQFKRDRRAEVQQQGEIARMSSLATQARLNGLNEAKRLQTAQLQVLEEAKKAAATPTDPNRYWNNKDVGQKAAAVVAGALFGFTGKGMEWLQRIDGLIESDMQVQQADRASLVGGLREQAAGLGVAGQRALQFGATEAEAHLIERDAKLEGLKSYLDMAQRETKNRELSAQAANMTAALSERQLGIRNQMAQLAEARAHNMNEDMYKREMLRLRGAEVFGELAIKRAMAGGAGAPQGARVGGSQAMELGGLRAAHKTALELKEKFGDKNIISRMLDRGAAMFPGTDATNYNVARDQAINMIAPMLGSGVLQVRDLERWEKLMAKAGDLSGTEKLDILVKDIARMYNEKRSALGQTGHDVSSMPPISELSGISFTPSK